MMLIPPARYLSAWAYMTAFWVGGLRGEIRFIDLLPPGYMYEYYFVRLRLATCD